MRLAYFDCFAGVAGNMALAAAADAGAGETAVRRLLAGLRLPGYTLRFSRRTAHGLAGLHAEVRLTGRRPPHRHLPDILRLIARARLPEAVKARSIAVFENLARAEAKVHQMPVTDVHFHEVGAVDAIVDVVGTVGALHLLGVGKIICSPLPLGQGEVRCEHGLLPVPAPAVLALLEGVPVAGGDHRGELVTPTGAALMRTLADEFGPLPALTLDRVGIGLGDRSLGERPNLLRLIVGDAFAAAETVVELQANLDDMPAERYDYLLEQLFAAGALDVAAIPAQMKKNRPGLLVQVLARPAEREAVVRTLLLHSTTLGVRYRELSRTVLPRRTATVALPGGRVRVKLALRPDGRETAHPEYDDLRRLARAAGRPLAALEAEALAALDAGKKPGRKRKT